MLRLETTGAKTVENFLNGSENQCESTAKEHRKRLDLFAKFVQENYDSLTLDELIETLTKEGRGPRIDVYQLAINYIAWLKRRGTMTPRSIKTWVLRGKMVRGCQSYHISDCYTECSWSAAIFGSRKVAVSE